MKRMKPLLIVLVTFILNFSLDRVTKHLAEAYLKGRAAISLLWNAIVVSYTENSGAFLGLGESWPPAMKYVVFLGVPLAVCAYGLFHCLAREADTGRIIIITTIIGGGLGNLVDRAFNDFRVIDFLNFGIGNFRTGVLNVADMSVTFGAIALVIYEYVLAAKKKRRA